MAKKRYRLTARAQMGGSLQDPGYEFDLDEDAGERGPMKTIVRKHDTVDVVNDNRRILGDHEDVKLYEPVA